MPSDRIQRQIDRLLDEAERAFGAREWALLRAHAVDVLKLDAENDDARMFLGAADQGLADEGRGDREQGIGPTPSSVGEGLVPSQASADARDGGAPALRDLTPGPFPSGEGENVTPSSFASGRYEVKRFLGEGGKKRVYLAHDTLLDRDVAFALIKTEGLDDAGRDRIRREAQSMGRLGSHPNIVSVFDLGTEPSLPGSSSPLPLGEGQGEGAGTPFMVTELMAGGDVEGAIEKAHDHKLPLDRALEIGEQVCRGLEFAHSQGIVHRDLKPGNVWLTADGVAKIGDFGLAVAIDRTRLTQAGMMIGTVSYMPPEQATGGEVTPRSDLYSLGAMLYEMVTGRPPFVGDEAVAIIGQHLNIAPVAPSWHNPDVPPGLEVLILRLLEKDPSKRPASATEVHEALETIAQAARHPSLPASLPQGERGDGSPPSPLEGEGLGMRGDARGLSDSRMYRRAFVGREQELKQFQAAYDAATSGQGSLVMVVGEPGIGKTSLCEQLATYATVRGGKTLVGHCYEEGSLSLPYLAFVEAMRSYVLSREPDALRSDLGSGAGEVARIVSEVRERARVEPSPATNDADEDRYRLFQAVTGFLLHAATVQPLLIVLEDLHDADRGTLDLLLHLSRSLSGSRLLLAGTYRDIEVDRTHPLSATLAELRRGANFGRVLLRGLTADEVHRMMSAIGGQDVRWETAEAVHRQTEGNPLFVQEVLRYLVEEGLIAREDGHWRTTGSTPLAMQIPEGLRDVIGKRLARLSSDCNRVLAVAAVIGRDFRLDTLQAVANVDEEALIAAIEEATRVAVLQESTAGRAGGQIQYRFAHAFFRQTLYEELSAPRRLRMHQEVARALERQYTNRLEEHAAELAEHFSQSTDHDDLAKAVHYAELAAQRALLVYAYGEAARHLEQALDVQEVLDPDDKAKRCDLLLALGDALLFAGEPRRVLDGVAPQALAAAQQLNSSAAASRACKQAFLSIGQLYGAVGVTLPVNSRWLAEMDRHAAPGTADRVLADEALAIVAYLTGRQREARDLAERAWQLAQELGDAETLYRAACRMVDFNWLPEHQDSRLQVANQVLQADQPGASARTMADFLCSCGRVLLAHGDRQRAEGVLAQAKEIADRTRDVSLSFRCAEHDIALLAIDGHLEEAAAAGERLRRRAEELGGGEGLGQYATYAAQWPLIHLGRYEEALDFMPQRRRHAALEGKSMTFSSELVLRLAYLDRWSDLAPLLKQAEERWDVAGQTFSLNVSILVHFLVAATLAGNHLLVGRISQCLAPVSKLIADRYPTVIARHLGDASALLGERERAMAYYQQALEVAGRVRFRPEIALTHLGIAELLLRSAPGTPADAMNRAPTPEAGARAGLKPAPTEGTGSVGSRHASSANAGETPAPPEVHAAALEHLDFAIAEFREMKMQPALERALRHKEVLKA